MSGRIPWGEAMPMRELKSRLNALIPRGARRQWETVAEIPAPDGELVVFDPVWFHPLEGDPQHTYDLRLSGKVGRARVMIERLRVSWRHWRNATIKILLAEDPVTSSEEIGEVGVDAGSLAVASPNLLSERWQLGGDHNETSVIIDLSLPDAERAAEIERVGTVLRSLGFEITRYHDWGWQFVRPLGSKELTRASTALQEAELKGHVGVTADSANRILSQLKRHHFALLDGKDRPYLVAFESGWGDGTYKWHALRSGTEVVGFYSKLIEVDE